MAGLMTVVGGYLMLSSRKMRCLDVGSNFRGFFLIHDFLKKIGFIFLLALTFTSAHADGLERDGVPQIPLEDRGALAFPLMAGVNVLNGRLPRLPLKPFNINLGKDGFEKVKKLYGQAHIYELGGFLGRFVCFVDSYDSPKLVVFMMGNSLESRDVIDGLALAEPSEFPEYAKYCSRRTFDLVNSSWSEKGFWLGADKKTVLATIDNKWSIKSEDQLIAHYVDRKLKSSSVSVEAFPVTGLLGVFRDDRLVFIRIYSGLSF